MADVLQHVWGLNSVLAGFLGLPYESGRIAVASWTVHACVCHSMHAGEAWAPGPWQKKHIDGQACGA